MPTIALLTDFGYADAYVGVMKAVLLARCPEARLLDLTHGIAAQDVLAGALQLASAVPYCPAGTVFLAVVDPGVGGERRAICLESGGHRFVGPDNGLLWPAASRTAASRTAASRTAASRTAASRDGAPRAFHLDRPEHWLLAQPGATFHGRDVFAPVAALLASGRAPDDLGTPVDDPVRLVPPRPAPGPDGVRGEVLFVDHFGNAVTNLRPEDLGHPAPDSVTFEIGEHTLFGPATHYAARAAGEALVVAGSLGYYEVAVCDGNAAEGLSLRRGSPLRARTKTTSSAVE